MALRLDRKIRRRRALDGDLGGLHLKGLLGVGREHERAGHDDGSADVQFGDLSEVRQLCAVHDLYLGEECAVGEIDEAEILASAQIANPAADLDGLPGKFFGFFEKGTHGDELFHIVFLAFGVYLLFI